MSDEDYNARLTDLIARFRPGVRLARVWPLKGGISSLMNAFEIETDESVERLIHRRPGDWAYKFDPNGMRLEFELHRALQGQGLPVSKGIYLDDPPEVFDRPSVTFEYMPGEPDYGPGDLEAYTARLASMMVRVHNVPLAGLPDLPRTWERRSKLMANPPDPLDDAQGEAELREVIIRAMKTRDAGPQVLMHADLWPGNILWADGEISALIDWEDAEIGNPLWDVAVTRSELLFNFGEEAIDRFTHAIMRESDMDFADLAFWDLCAALRPMNCFAEWAAAGVDIGRTDITEELIRARHLEFVAQALKALR